VKAPGSEGMRGGGGEEGAAVASSAAATLKDEVTENPIAVKLAVKKENGGQKKVDKEGICDKSSGDGETSSGPASCDGVSCRPPIIAMVGDSSGKRRLLDKIQCINMQDLKARGIMQQIDATFIPSIALQQQTKKLDEDFKIEVPGLMILDVPGHQSFVYSNFRAGGSCLCDLAVLVIDITFGLEPQTLEWLDVFKKRMCPFLIALNGIDVCYQWNSKNYTGIRNALNRQEQFVLDEFQARLSQVMLQLNATGLNAALYWENEDPGSTVSIVPTSALTGEGVPDLSYMLLHFTQTQMGDSLELKDTLDCTVVEVRDIDGLGATIDVIVVNGTLREGDQIILSGINVPIVTTIHALLTPQLTKEVPKRNGYVRHASISTASVRICAPGLEEAVAGTQLIVLGPDDDIEKLKLDAQGQLDSMLSDFEKQSEGVLAKAGTWGSLQALMFFLKDMKVPVFDVGIGDVRTVDVNKVLSMKRKRHPEYALILAFDVKVNDEAKLQADEDNVQIMTADIIYHLFDKFEQHMRNFKDRVLTEMREAAAAAPAAMVLLLLDDSKGNPNRPALRPKLWAIVASFLRCSLQMQTQAIFPVVLQIDKQRIFHTSNPIVFGCTVVGGQLRTGTPICVPERDNLVIGRIAAIEKDHKLIEKAWSGDQVCVKIEQTSAESHIAYGRHFDHGNHLYSHITRQSIDTLKDHFRDEMRKEDWELVIRLKTVFAIPPPGS